MRSIDPLLMIIFLNGILLLSIGLFIPMYDHLKVNKSSDETCRDAGGIELPHIFHFDYKNKLCSANILYERCLLCVGLIQPHFSLT